MLLAAPLNVLILQALAEGSKRLAELHREAGLPAQTTLRAQLKRLVEIGAIEKHRRNRFPGVLEYELTVRGAELLSVADALERWLAMAPGPVDPLGGTAAKAAVNALAEGWSTTMLRALSAQPLSLTELDRVIASLSYPSLERRLSALRVAGLIESQPGDGRGTPYAVTAWLRHGMAPLLAAASWERRHKAPIAASFGRLDVEAAFLLSVPLLLLPAELSGCCRLGAEIGNGTSSLAGAMVGIENGRISTCTTQLQGSPDAWALGSVSAWFGALIGGDPASLELGGDGKLARALTDGLHRSLFGAPVRNS